MEWNFLGSVPAIIWAKDPGQMTFVSKLIYKVGMIMVFQSGLL